MLAYLCSAQQGSSGLGVDLVQAVPVHRHHFSSGHSPLPAHQSLYLRPALLPPGGHLPVPRLPGVQPAAHPGRPQGCGLGAQQIQTGPPRPHLPLAGGCPSPLAVPLLMLHQCDRPRTHTKVYAVGPCNGSLCTEKQPSGRWGKEGVRFLVQVIPMIAGVMLPTVQRVVA